MNKIDYVDSAHKTVDTIWSNLDDDAKIASYLGICSWDAGSYGASILYGAPCLVSWKERVNRISSIYKDKAMYPIPSANFPERKNENIFKAAFDKCEYSFSENDDDNQMLMKEIERLGLNDEFSQSVIDNLRWSCLPDIFQMKARNCFLPNAWDVLAISLKDKAKLALKFLEKKLGNPLIKLELWKWAIYPKGLTYETYDDG